MTSDKEVLRSLFLRVLRRKLAVWRRETGGVNSRTYRLRAQTGERYIAKFYPAPSRDKRRRLKTEYEGLSFLWKKGIRFVPQPVFCDGGRNLGVYRFVCGRRLRPGEMRATHLKEAVRDLGRIARLARCAPRAIPTASEACFSLKEYLENLRGRIGRLQRVPNGALRVLLRKEVMPLWRLIEKHAMEEARRWGVGMGERLERSKKVLSPSDVGFHNILKEDGTGRLVLIDFEYFGWDDPVKMACDFLLQPELPVPRSLRALFVRIFLEEFSHDKRLPVRFRLVYPLLGMRWCLIILNCFLKDGKARSRENRKLYSSQIAKCRRQLVGLRACVCGRGHEKWLEAASHVVKEARRNDA